MSQIQEELLVKMPFKTVTFWSEFPDKVDWTKFKKLIDFPADIYVACKNKKNYGSLKNKVKSKYINVGAWPILSFEEGYWFSGLTPRNAIDSLTDFSGIKIKIDLEPPIRKDKWSGLSAFSYLPDFLGLRKYPNNNYLKQKIYDLSEDTEIIASGFPLPNWIRRNIGGDINQNKNIKYNYFIYTTFFSQPIKWILNFYYKWFIRKHLKKDSEKNFFALGCIGVGVYGNEQIYKDVKEFIKDLEMFNKLGVKNLVVFEVAGIMNRKKPEEWINAIKDCLK